MPDDKTRPTDETTIRMQVAAAKPQDVV